MNKFNKNISLVIVLCLIFVLSFVNVNAHEVMLNVKYDGCTGVFNGDGEDEVWYYLNEADYSKGSSFEYRHIDNNDNTIYYYFNDSAETDSTFTWDDAGSETIGNQIKEAYANSMKKWNDVYFYSYDSNGNRTTKKVINIEEVKSKETSNLIIYPAEPVTEEEKNSDIRAATGFDDSEEEYLETIETGITNITHIHPEKWYMHVYINEFYAESTATNEINKVNETKSRTGAHEIGHVLGLDDVDECCEVNVYNTVTKTYGKSNHHEEILMGYAYEDKENNGDQRVPRQTEITYKDIAGVSITRGFHTDNDHIWMKRTNSNGNIDLICAICNGVLFDITLDSNNTTYQGKTVRVYGSCTNHNINSSNMLLVATNGKMDFYKCLCCRHIESHNIDDTISEIKEESNITNNSSLNKNTSYIKLDIDDAAIYNFNITSTSAVNIEL